MVFNFECKTDSIFAIFRNKSCWGCQEGARHQVHAQNAEQELHEARHQGQQASNPLPRQERHVHVELQKFFKSLFSDFKMGTLSKSNMCRLCGWEDEKNMRIEEQEVCIVINSMNLLTAKVSELIEQNMNLILETSLDLPDKICPECKTGVQVGHIQNS